LTEPEQLAAQERAFAWRVAIVGGTICTVVGGIIGLGIQASFHGIARLSADQLLRFVLIPALGLGFVTCLGGFVYSLRQTNDRLWDEVGTMAEDIDDLRDQLDRLRQLSAESTTPGTDGPLPSPSGWSTW
jgi:hypothetical protein